MDLSAEKAAFNLKVWFRSCFVQVQMGSTMWIRPQQKKAKLGGVGERKKRNLCWRSLSFTEDKAQSQW